MAWIKGVATGDLGESLSFRRPVGEVIGPALVNSAKSLWWWRSCLDVDADALADVVHEIGDAATGYTADVADDERMRAVVEEAENSLGGMDIIVATPPGGADCPRARRPTLGRERRAAVWG